MEIREATEQDLLGIVPIQMEVQELHHTAYPEIYTTVDRNKCIEIMNKFWKDHSTTVIVAIEKETILGFGILKIEDVLSSPLRHSSKVGTLEQLAVISTAHRKGIATALMAEVTKRAQQHGCSQLRLDVLEFNQDARHFYEHLGFETYLRRMIRWLDR